MMKPPKVRAPQQARSRESLERIYQAVNLISKQKAFDQLTIAEIATAANVAVGTIYHRFSSKDDLLLELYEHYIREAASAVDEMISNASTSTNQQERVRNVIQIISRLFLSHRGIVRSFVLKSLSNRNDVPSSYYQEIDKIVAQVDGYLRAGKITAKRAKICRSFILANCREHILFENFEGFARSNSKAEFQLMLAHAADAILAMDREDL